MSFGGAAYGTPGPGSTGGANIVDPYLSFLGAAGGGSSNTMANIVQQLESGQGANIGLSGIQAALAGQQYNINQAQYGLTNYNLEQQAANQLGQLGISQAQIGLQGQGLQAEAGLLGVTTGLEQEEYGLQQQQYPEQLGLAAMNYGANRRNLIGNEAASGALNTTGSAQQQGMLGFNYYWQAADIQRAQKESQLQQQATSAQQLYSAGDLARQEQNLQLVAQSNGLSVQEVYQQLGYGLAQAGLDVQQNLPQLLNSLTSIYAGDLSAIQGAALPAGLLSSTALGGVNPYPAGISPGVSSSG